MKPRLLPALLLTVVSLLLAGSLSAADVVTVGTVTASGSTADVPVYIRDSSGTPLGMDRPAGSRIQGISIKVDYSPASAISSVTFSRAGVTAGLSPTFETSPSSPGSISLLMSFPESTNTIPFSLNAGAPGDVVAHLVFTLSSSAAPGSTIALSLDSSLTQLSDEGGTAATKETVSNGQLDLVNGAIGVAPLSISLTPANTRLQPGSGSGLTVTASSNVTVDTTVTLSSDSPSVASVPATVVILAGSKSASFEVTAVALGTATITAALPPAAGGATATAIVSVVEAPPPCDVPLAPLVTAPASALSGATYTVSWSPVSNASEYRIEEATDPTFVNAVTRTITTTSSSFSHTAATDVRYYYRVRAFNKANGCFESSAYSATAVVLVAPAPVAPASRVLAVVGSTPGGFGSYFRTSVQLFNAGTSAVSGRIVFHAAGVSAAASDPFLVYTIGAGKTVTYADLLPALGVASGIGSADVVADTGSLFPIAAVRVFNDGGAAGTTGLAQEMLRLEEALQAGQTGALITPADVTRFRLNVGVRSLDQGATMTITARDAAGTVVKTVQRAFPPSYFVQTSASALLDNYNFAGGETLTFRIDAGSAFVYGATTDNTTNDPSQQFAKKVE